MATILNVNREGKPLAMGDTRSRIIVSREIGARHVTVNYTRYEPGDEFPQHVHEESEDVLFVFTGSGWLKEGERMTPIQAGDVIFVRPGEVHGVVAGPSGMAAFGLHGPPDPQDKRLGPEARAELSRVTRMDLGIDGEGPRHDNINLGGSQAW